MDDHNKESREKEISDYEEKIKEAKEEIKYLKKLKKRKKELEEKELKRYKVLRELVKHNHLEDEWLEEYDQLRKKFRYKKSH